MKKIFQLINKNLSFFSLAGFQKKRYKAETVASYYQQLIKNPFPD
jgi:hypothetical protein